MLSRKVFLFDWKLLNSQTFSSLEPDKGARREPRPDPPRRLPPRDDGRAVGSAIQAAELGLQRGRALILVPRTPKDRNRGTQAEQLQQEGGVNLARKGEGKGRRSGGKRKNTLIPRNFACY